MLPATLAYNTFGFECRLGEENPRADFLVLARASWGRDSLAGLHPDKLSAQSYLMDDPVWQRVQDFGARWADPASPLYGAVDNVWLEFDVDGPAGDIPVPSVFFGLPANGAGRGGLRTGSGGRPGDDREKLYGFSRAPNSRPACSRL